MIPVTGGSIAPPKKRTNHRQIPKYLKFTNGIGRAKTTASNPKKPWSFCAFFVLYPPALVVMIPPTITPDIGADILVPAKKIAVISDGTPSTFYK